MRIKDEMIKISKRLHELYPGKHISIEAEALIFFHNGKPISAWGYSLYVAKTIPRAPFNSLADMRAAVESKQINVRGNRGNNDQRRI